MVAATVAIAHAAPQDRPARGEQRPTKNPLEGNAQAISNGGAMFRNAVRRLPRSRRARLSRPGPDRRLGRRRHRRADVRHRPARRARHRDDAGRSAARARQGHLADARLPAHAERRCRPHRRRATPPTANASSAPIAAAATWSTDAAGSWVPICRASDRRRPRAGLLGKLRGTSDIIRPGYEPVTLVTRDGERIRGVRKNEDEFSIQIMDTRERLQGYLKANLTESDDGQAVADAGVRSRAAERSRPRRSPAVLDRRFARNGRGTRSSGGGDMRAVISG